MRSLPVAGRCYHLLSHLIRLGVSISIAGACTRFGCAGSGSDFGTDQSRNVYLVPGLDRFCKFDLARGIAHGVDVLRGKKCYSAQEVQPCGTGLSVYSEPDK